MINLFSLSNKAHYSLQNKLCHYNVLLYNLSFEFTTSTYRELNCCGSNGTNFNRRATICIQTSHIFIYPSCSFHRRVDVKTVPITLVEPARNRLICI